MHLDMHLSLKPQRKLPLKGLWAWTILNSRLCHDTSASNDLQYNFHTVDQTMVLMRCSLTSIALLRF